MITIITDATAPGTLAYIYVPSPTAAPYKYISGSQNFPITTLKFGGDSVSVLDFTIKDLRFGTGGFF